MTFSGRTDGRTVFAENLIGLSDVELAGVRLLPFPDRARPFVISAHPFSSDFAAQPAMRAEIIARKLAISSEQ
jgi:hypothetical protein